MEAILYNFAGNLMLPYLSDPTDSELRRHCMDWIHGFSIIHILKYALQLNLPVIILEGTVNALIKRLIAIGAS